MAPRPRLPLVLLLFTVVLGELSCEGESRRLHGSVACLDCAAGEDLSGVVVAVKCAAGINDDTALHLYAAETNSRGAYGLLAARVIGATRRLCAPPGLTVARGVVPERAYAGSSSSYALASRLVFFTRCGGPAAATTMGVGRDPEQHAAPRVPSPRPRAPVMRSPPPAGGSDDPYGMGGLPLIYLFPFIPIISIP